MQPESATGLDASRKGAQLFYSTIAYHMYRPFQSQHFQIYDNMRLFINGQQIAVGHSTHYCCMDWALPVAAFLIRYFSV